MKAFFDLRTDFFLPPLRRIVATTICIGWALFELANGAAGFAALFGAAGLMMVYQFFLSGWPPGQQGGDDQ